MFKKLLALLTFSVALVQPVYSSEDTDELIDKIMMLVAEYNSGNKKGFEAVEKGLLEDKGVLDLNLKYLMLSQMYFGTKQYKKSIKPLERFIDNQKTNGLKDVDLALFYRQLGIALVNENNVIRGKHYVGIACDNGDQAGCEAYKILNQ